MTGPRSCARAFGCRASRPNASRGSCASWPRSSKTSIATRSRAARARPTPMPMPADRSPTGSGWLATSGSPTAVTPGRDTKIHRAPPRTARRRTAGAPPPKSGGLLMFANTVRDVRYAIRQMAQDPGFTVVAILTLGARHRRQQRHLQRGQRRPSSAAGLPRPGVAGAGARGPAEVRPLLGRPGHLPRLAAAEHGVRAHRGHEFDRGHARRRVRRRASQRRSRVLGHVRSAPRLARSRQDVPSR